LFKKRAFRLLFGLLFIPLTSLAEPVENPPEAIRGVLEHLESCPAAPRTLDQAALDRLSELYRRHGFEPLWTSYAQIQNLVAQLEALTDDGLDSALYQPQQVGRQLQTATADPLHRPCSDVLASHAYVLALQHLSQGRLHQEQLEPVWHSSSASETVSSQRVLQLAEQGLANPEQAFDQARPAIEQYRNLRKAYVRLRDTPAPAWPNIPAGQTLRPGMSDPRVPLLRERLASEGYLETALPLEGADDRHGPMLVEALKRFQAQHALQDDGVLGAGTLAALNATPADRLDQLRANLERFRWLAGDIEADLAAGGYRRRPGDLFPESPSPLGSPHAGRSRGAADPGDQVQGQPPDAQPDLDGTADDHARGQAAEDPPGPRLSRAAAVAGARPAGQAAGSRIGELGGPRCHHAAPSGRPEQSTGPGRHSLRQPLLHLPARHA